MRPRLSALTARIDVESVRRGSREAALIGAQHSEGDRLRVRHDGVGRRHDEGTGLQAAGELESAARISRQTRKQRGENTRSTFDEPGASNEMQKAVFNSESVFTVEPDVLVQAQLAPEPVSSVTDCDAAQTSAHKQTAGDEQLARNIDLQAIDVSPRARRTRLRDSDVSGRQRRDLHVQIHRGATICERAKHAGQTVSFASDQRNTRARGNSTASALSKRNQGSEPCETRAARYTQPSSQNKPTTIKKPSVGAHRCSRRWVW